ncbi:MAG: hypothetical protein ACRC6V_04575 [Bacteroidales bacterium]
MDDIVIETGDVVAPFDFDQIVEDDAIVDIPAEEVEEEVEVEVDADEVEVEEEEVEEVEEEVEEVEVDESGEEEVDYEGYEITLPSGEEVNLAQLVQGFKDNTALVAERTEFETIKADFEAKSQNLAQMMEMSILESQQAVDSYSDYDWSTVSKEDPKEYADNREYFEHHRKRIKEVTSAYNDMKAKEKDEVESAEKTKIQEANAALVRDLPGWGQKMYEDLMRFAVEKGGFDQEYVTNNVSAAFFKMLHRNKTIEEGVQKVTAKVKKKVAPKKTIKNTSSKPTVSKDAARDQAIKAAAAKGDMSAWFMNLTD